mmetsp:Transcript_124323/g.357256  ORF Transcript_124323/g.357256 Transcript_124323/m.357256 type:complete len:306 (+) Transcript_124323:1229-2146(+)
MRDFFEGLFRPGLGLAIQGPDGIPTASDKVVDGHQSNEQSKDPEHNEDILGLDEREGMQETVTVLQQPGQAQEPQSPTNAAKPKPINQIAFLEYIKDPIHANDGSVEDEPRFQVVAAYVARPHLHVAFVFIALKERQQDVASPNHSDEQLQSREKIGLRQLIRLEGDEDEVIEQDAECEEVPSHSKPAVRPKEAARTKALGAEYLGFVARRGSPSRIGLHPVHAQAPGTPDLRRQIAFQLLPHLQELQFLHGLGKRFMNALGHLGADADSASHGGTVLELIVVGSARLVLDRLLRVVRDNHSHPA